MYRHLAVASIVLCLAACATAGNGPDEMAANSDAPAIAGEPDVAEHDASGIYDDVEVPTVPRADDIVVGSGVKCTYERTTGSHRLTKICRTEAQIESRRAADQQMIKKVQSTPVPPPPTN